MCATHAASVPMIVVRWRGGHLNVLHTCCDQHLKAEQMPISLRKSGEIYEKSGMGSGGSEGPLLFQILGKG